MLQRSCAFVVGLAIFDLLSLLNFGKCNNTKQILLITLQMVTMTTFFWTLHCPERSVCFFQTDQRFPDDPEKFWTVGHPRYNYTSDFSWLNAAQWLLPNLTSIIDLIIIIIINEFHRDASLTKTSGPLCVTCFTSVNGTVAGSVRCRMIYGTVLSSVHA